MRVEVNQNCKMPQTCNAQTSMTLEVAKSMEVDKTNTLHQHDTAGIVGVQSPVGKIPIVFYVKETCNSGRRGILYYDDYDSICFMFPEYEHAEWCEQPYDMKYDAVEAFDNGVESGMRRNHGIFELWASVYRKWYNGQVLYRPQLKIQNCVSNDGYPRKKVEQKVEVKDRSKNKVQVVPVKRKANHSCGCGK